MWIQLNAWGESAIQSRDKKMHKSSRKKHKKWKSPKNKGTRNVGGKRRKVKCARKKNNKREEENTNPSRKRQQKNRGENGVRWQRHSSEDKRKTPWLKKLTLIPERASRVETEDEVWHRQVGIWLLSWAQGGSVSTGSDCRNELTEKKTILKWENWDECEISRKRRYVETKINFGWEAWNYIQK